MNTSSFFSLSVSRLALIGTVVSTTILSGCALNPFSRSEAPPKAATKKNPAGVRLIGEQTIPNGLNVHDTTVGGLSGIDYDPAKNVWYLLSDDPSKHSPARFYTAKLSVQEGSLGKIEWVSAVTIKRPDGSAFPGANSAEAAFPEAMRFDRLTQSLLWVSEGERRPGFIAQPTVRKMGLDGKYLDKLNLPNMFTITSDNAGPRHRLNLEGMALSSGHDHIWLAMEDAMIQDGPLASLTQGSLARITKFDRHARKAVAQYAYPVDPIPQPPVPINDFASNGVAEILVVNDTTLLVLERAYSNGKGNTIRLFEASTQGASDVLNTAAIAPGSIRPMKKTLVVDFSALGLRQVHNIEGMAWGPKLASGRRSLVLIADDNFSASQNSQLIALEWKE